MSVRQLMAGAVIALGVFSVPAGAVTFSGTGTGPNAALSASADFQKVGNDLVVTLTNTSTADVENAAQVLTALFWTGTSGLTPESALLASGSVVYYDNDPVPNGQPAGGNVGGEWVYNQSTGPGSSNQGIGSSGVGGWFGNGNPKFNGPDLDPPVNVGGVNYGILSAGDNPGTGNGGITGSGGLIKNSVVFTLSGLPANFALSTIANVVFQYGTSQNEPRYAGNCVSGTGCSSDSTPVVPVPAALPLLLTALGLGGIASLRRRRKA